MDDDQDPLSGFADRFGGSAPVAESPPADPLEGFVNRFQADNATETDPRMIEARARYRGNQESVGSELARRGIPIVAGGVRMALRQRYDLAQQNLASGAPEGWEYDAIAHYEQLQQQEQAQQQTVGGQLRAAATSAPALLGEMQLLGGPTRAAGAGVGRLFGTTPVVARLAGAGATAGAFAAVAPSMGAVDNAQALADREGGNWYDPQNLGRGYGMATLNALVLGQLQRFTGAIPGGGALGWATRTAAGGVVGTAEQAAANEIGYWAGLQGQQGHGVIRSILENRRGEAGQQALVDLVTMTAFSAMHAPGQHQEVRDVAREAMNEATRTGSSPAVAAERAREAVAEFRPTPEGPSVGEMMEQSRAPEAPSAQPPESATQPQEPSQPQAAPQAEHPIQTASRLLREAEVTHQQAEQEYSDLLKARPPKGQAQMDARDRQLDALRDRAEGTMQARDGAQLDLIRLMEQERQPQASTTPPPGPPAAPPEPSAPPTPPAAPQGQLRGTDRLRANLQAFLGGPAPQWMKDNVGALAQRMIENGTAKHIEDMAARYMTAKDIAAAMGLEKDQVAALRAALGIPSQVIGAGASQSTNPEFEPWRQRVLAEAAPQGQPTPPAAPPATPGAADRILASYRMFRQSGLSQEAATQRARSMFPSMGEWSPPSRPANLGPPLPERVSTQPTPLAPPQTGAQRIQENMRRRSRGLAPLPTPSEPVLRATGQDVLEPLTAPEREAEARAAAVRYEDIPEALRQRVEAVAQGHPAGITPDTVRETARGAFAFGGEEGLHELLRMQEERLGPQESQQPPTEQEVYSAQQDLQREIEHAVQQLRDLGIDETSIRRAVAARLRSADEIASTAHAPEDVAAAPREGAGPEAGAASGEAAGSAPANVGGGQASRDVLSRLEAESERLQNLWIEQRRMAQEANARGDQEGEERARIGLGAVTDQIDKLQSQMEVAHVRGQNPELHGGAGDWAVRLTTYHQPRGAELGRFASEQEAFSAAQKAKRDWGETAGYRFSVEHAGGSEAGGNVVGNATSIFTPSGSVPGRYEVRELGDVRASHEVRNNGSLRPRPDAEYPQSLQPRNYEATGEQEKIDRITKGLVPDVLVTNHPAASEGPPTITPDGTVLNGNGRQMALERASQVGTFERYKRYLIEHAAEFGLDPDTVSKMKRPVLYRVVDLDPRGPQASSFAAAGNVALTQGQSPVRTAASLSRLVSPDLIDSLRLEGDTTFSEAVSDPKKGKAFRDRLRGSLPPQEVQRFFTADGMLTEGGKEMVRDMLVTKLLPVELVERMGESMKGVKRSIEGATPQLLQILRDAPAGNVAPQLHEALDLWMRNPDLRSVADADHLLSQGSLFGGMHENVSPEGRMMLDFLLTNGQKPLVFRQAMARLVRDLTGKEGGLFGEQYPDIPSLAAEALGVERREGAVFGDERGILEGVNNAARNAQNKGFSQQAVEGTVQEGISSGKGAGENEELARQRGQTQTGAAAAPGSAGAGVERNQPSPGGPGEPLPPTENRPAGGTFGEGPLIPSGGDRRTALAHEVARGERVREELGTIEEQARQSDPAVWDAARRANAADPTKAKELAQDIVSAQGKRGTTAEEQALLLHRRISVRNELANAQQDLERNAIDMPDRTFKAKQQKLKDLAAERDLVDRASDWAGSEAGRALRFRRMFAKFDYSLDGLLGRMGAAAKRPLTQEEITQITALHGRIQDLEGQLEALRAAGHGGGPSEPGFQLSRARTALDSMEGSLREQAQAAPVRFFRNVFDVLNLPRSLMSAIDFPLLRQGFIAAVSHPVRTAQAVPDMLRAFASKDAAERAQYLLLNRPNAELYRQAGLELTSWEGPLNSREEGFVSRLAERTPGIGQLVQASERSYHVVLNRIRADSFDAMASTLAKKDRLTMGDAKLLANYVNVMTGRGPLGAAEKAGNLLSQVFFAPRWAVSRWQYLLGQPIWSGKGEGLRPDARKLIATEYARFGAGVGMIAAAAVVAGFRLEDDSRSPDFGKIKIGNTRLDITGALTQPLVLTSRLLSGKRKTVAGELRDVRGPGVRYGDTTASDLAWNYIRGRFAPAPGAAMDLMAGSDVTGRPVTVAGEAERLVTPLYVRDVYEAYRDLGLGGGTAASLLGLAGLNMQTYEPGDRGEQVGPLRALFGTRGELPRPAAPRQQEKLRTGLY